MNIPGHHFSYQEKRLENMNNSFEENINTCRNRSISLTIKIPKEFIPRLKPKKGTTIPSPITLSSLKVNYFSNINLSSKYSLSFDKNDPSQGMQLEMEGRIRSKTQSRFKDDTVILSTDKLLKEYVNISNNNIKVEGRRSLEFWSLQRKRDSSILGYIESENNLTS